MKNWVLIAGPCKGISHSTVPLAWWWWACSGFKEPFLKTHRNLGIWLEVHCTPERSPRALMAQVIQQFCRIWSLLVCLFCFLDTSCGPCMQRWDFLFGTSVKRSLQNLGRPRTQNGWATLVDFGWAKVRSFSENPNGRIPAWIGRKEWQLQNLEPSWSMFARFWRAAEIFVSSDCCWLFCFVLFVSFGPWILLKTASPFWFVAVAFARQFATIQRCGSPKALAVQAKVSAQGPMLGQSSLGVFGETWKNCWSESQVAARCGKCKKPNDERIQAVKQ